MAALRRKFKNEFLSSNFGFQFLYIGECKNIFIHSKIKCLNATHLLTLRLLVATYLLFAMILSIAGTSRPSTWLLHLTSLNYVLVFTYFASSVFLCCFGMFCKIKYYKEEQATMRNQYAIDSVLNLKETKLSTEQVKTDLTALNTSSSCLVESGTTLNNRNLRYSMESIIFDIEQNSNRTSIQTSSPIPEHINHARLKDNRLPSVTSDVFLDTPTTMNWVFKMHWMTSSVCLNLSTVTTCVYWAMLYPHQDNHTSSMLNWYLKLDRHVLIYVFIIIDHMISKIPIRLLHFIYPSILLLLYSGFNYVYFKLSGEIIYSMLDFQHDPIKSLLTVIAACFVAIPCAQLVLYWGVFRLRERIFRFQR